MKISCSRCGWKSRLSEIETTIREYALDDEDMACPNPECDRIILAGELNLFVEVLDKRAASTRWPGFPLFKPVTPKGRRKNGARPGTSFKKLSHAPIDRAPTDQEIARVRRHFASFLDEGGDCPCCRRYAQRQHRPLGTGPARWLLELVRLSDDGQFIHTGEVLKSLDGNQISGSDATSVLPLYGLIESPAREDIAADSKVRTSGLWRSTELGRRFANDKVSVPARVVTCLGIPEAFEGDPISIREALGKNFDYDEIMGRR